MNGHQAFITQEAWDANRRDVEYLQDGQGKILAEASDAKTAAKGAHAEATAAHRAAEKTLNEVLIVKKMIQRTNRRVDSSEDWSRDKELADTRRDLKRLRSLPQRIFKWAGLVLGTAAALLELAHRFGIMK